MGPLQGVRILDLTVNVMGPFASLLLADLGADVAKVEPPAGDTMRRVGPARHPGMSVSHLHLNRNKRSLALDLKRPEGAQTLREMVKQADVLLHSLRPQAMERLGLTYAELSAINPGLVYCGAFGFGQDGPYAARPAYDDLMQAAVGVPLLQSRKSGPPEYVALAIADRTVGMATSIAVASALYRRSVTGRGQEVQVPMLETFAQFVLGDHLYGHTFEPPIGDWGYERMMNPERRPYATLDGYLAVSPYIDKHWQALFALAGRDDMATDPRFADVGGRAANMPALYAFLAETFTSRTTAEWIQLLEEADIPAIAMNTPATIVDDPHVRAVDFLPVVEHPSEGPIRSIGIPSSWSEDKPEVRYQAPRLGENSVELLEEYGIATPEITRLIESGVVLVAEKG